MGRSRRRRKDEVAGVALIDKPGGLTSFDVVKRIRRALDVAKAGHTGTLDPMATGLLPVCFGEATKIASLLLADDKSYGGRAALGVETDTLDITGTEQRRGDPSGVTEAALAEAMAGQVGEIEQVPPAFSAIHTGGERAHEAARRGEAVDLPPRPVRVDRFELLGFEAEGQGELGLPELEFVVACGKGTYVRSLVRDVGQALGCGATLTSLRRLSVGPFSVEQAVPLEALTAPRGEGVLTMDEALAPGYPAVEVDADQARRLGLGQPVNLVAPPGIVRLRHGGKLFGLGEHRKGELWPKRMFRRDGVGRGDEMVDGGG